MPAQTVDVAIVGGGVLGLSAAYHLLTLGVVDTVAVCEQDPLHQRSSTGLSAGGVRDLFSSRVNIELARYSIRFFKEFPVRTATRGGPGPEINFRQQGYLFLMDRQNEEGFLRRADLQETLGVDLERLDARELGRRYPALRTDDLTGAIFGKSDGFLDPYQVMRGLRQKVAELGATFVDEQVVGITVEGGRAAGVRTPGATIAARRGVVDAAGAWGGEVARLAGLDVPVTPVVRQVYLCRPAEDLFGGYPFVGAPGGLYFHPEPGGRLLVGKAMPDDIVGFSWDWDRRRFEDRLWPQLADRVPVLERLRLEGGWAGLVENTPDLSGIIGEHPGLRSFHLLTGFSGLGLMLAPGAGLALAEIVAGGSARSIDVRDLRPGRFAEGSGTLEEKTM